MKLKYKVATVFAALATVSTVIPAHPDPSPDKFDMELKRYDR